MPIRPPCSSLPVLRRIALKPDRACSLALALILCLASLGVVASQAQAHGRSVSYSAWTIEPTGATVVLRLKLLELSRLGPEALPADTFSSQSPNFERPGERPAQDFPRQLALWADDQRCQAPDRAQREPDEPGWVKYRWRVECPENPERLVIQSRLLLDVAPSHLHFARVRTAGTSEHARERVLTEASSQFVVREPSGAGTESSSGSAFVDYVRLGVEHILSGWDHLAFVLGLLLLARRPMEVARLITGFTLAHSLTLALAVLDWVHPRASAVEAVIAFSVALVAIEKGWLLSNRDRRVPAAVVFGLGIVFVASALGHTNLAAITPIGLIIFSLCYFGLVARSQNEWLRVCLTFAFGLVHGFGFAGILVEMSLPSDRLVPALLGFNVGVELGQLGVVLLLWPLLSAGQRLLKTEQSRRLTEAVAAGLCGVGLYWFALRVFSA